MTMSEGLAIDAAPASTAGNEPVALLGMSKAALEAYFQSL
jgi:hypothetical protein